MKIKEYLDNTGIAYSVEGEKNVTTGHVEISCPYCSDPSRHLGINLESGLFHCWVCGESGMFNKLIQKLEGISWLEAKKKFTLLDEEFVEGSFGDISRKIKSILSEEIKEERITFEKVSLPKEARKTWESAYYELLWMYLRKRGIDNSMEKRHRLHYCKTGFYAHRLIIPIYNMEGDLIGFIARDMTERAEIKYLNNKGLDKRNHLYGLNLFSGDTMILVEGCIDSIIVGEGAVALMGKEMSDIQEMIIYDLYRKKVFSKLVVALDSDAWKDAIRIGMRLKTIVSDVKVLSLPIGKDPADLGRNKLLEFIKEE